MTNMEKWPKLSNAPIVAALFQVKFENGSISLDDCMAYDEIIKRILPNRHNHIAANIELPTTEIPLGTSTISGTSKAKMESYTYFDKSQNTKFSITENSLTLVDESEYCGWESFVSKSIKLMSIYDAILQDKTMLRISIRFINEFHFDNFDDPTEYVKTLISSTTDIIYPVSKYSYKLVCDLSRDAFSNVNHSLNKVGDEYSYIFDIDVLKRVNLLYDKDTVSDTLNELRVFKNNLFFGNLTDKTIELCK